MTTNQVYLSSETDRTKRAKLNNVIQSLDCFVSCTTNDKTQQLYGTIEYCGVITDGQAIAGTKPPMCANVPVSTVNGVWVGNINEAGNLIIKNTNEVVCSTTCATVNKSASYNVYTYCKIGEEDKCELIGRTTNTCTFVENGFTVTCTTITSCCKHTIRKLLRPNDVDVICHWYTRQQNPRSMLRYNQAQGWHVVCGDGWGLCGHRFYISDNRIIGCTRYQTNYNFHTYEIEVGSFDIDNECVNLYGISYVKCLNQRMADGGSGARASDCWDNQYDYSSVEMIVDTTFTNTTCTFSKPISDCVCISQMYM